MPVEPGSVKFNPAAVLLVWSGDKFACRLTNSYGRILGKVSIALLQVSMVFSHM
jgi:hypothetical protein